MANDRREHDSIENQILSSTFAMFRALIAVRNDQVMEASL
jgi:hypothetical protein